MSYNTVDTSKSVKQILPLSCTPTSPCDAFLSIISNVWYHKYKGSNIIPESPDSTIDT